MGLIIDGTNNKINTLKVNSNIGFANNATGDISGVWYIPNLGVDFYIGIAEPGATDYNLDSFIFIKISQIYINPVTITFNHIKVSIPFVLSLDYTSNKIKVSMDDEYVNKYGYLSIPYYTVNADTNNIQIKGSILAENININDKLFFNENMIQTKEVENSEYITIPTKSKQNTVVYTLDYDIDEESDPNIEDGIIYYKIKNYPSNFDSKKIINFYFLATKDDEVYKAGPYYPDNMSYMYATNQATLSMTLFDYDSLLADLYHDTEAEYNYPSLTAYGIEYSNLQLIFTNWTSYTYTFSVPSCVTDIQEEVYVSLNNEQQKPLSEITEATVVIYGNVVKITVYNDKPVTVKFKKPKGFLLDGNYQITKNLFVTGTTEIGGDVSIGGSLTIPSSRSIQIDDIVIKNLKKTTANNDGSYTLVDNKFYFVRGTGTPNNSSYDPEILYGLFYNNSEFKTGSKPLSMIQTTSNNFYIYASPTSSWTDVTPHKVRFYCGQINGLSDPYAYNPLTEIDVYELPLIIGMTLPSDN